MSAKGAKKLSRNRILQLMERNPKCSSRFLIQVRKLTINDFRLGHPLALKAERMALEVLEEIDRCLTLTRFRIRQGGILYGGFDPNMKVEDLVVSAFFSRYPMFVVALSSRRGVFIKGPEMDRTVVSHEPMENVLLELGAADREMDFCPSIWESYYRKKYIPSRKELRNFYQYLPKRYSKLIQPTMEMNYQEISLDEFI